MNPIEQRINVVADTIATEGMIVRASTVREGAAEIARQRHEIERLQARCKTLENTAKVNGSVAKHRGEQIKRLREALRPFVAFLGAYPRPRIAVSADDTIIVSARDVHLTLADLDRAREALGDEQPVEKEP